MACMWGRGEPWHFAFLEGPCLYRASVLATEFHCASGKPVIALLEVFTKYPRMASVKGEKASLEDRLFVCELCGIKAQKRYLTFITQVKEVHHPETTMYLLSISFMASHCPGYWGSGGEWVHLRPSLIHPGGECFARVLRCLELVKAYMLLSSSMNPPCPHCHLCTPIPHW